MEPDKTEKTSRRKLVGKAVRLLRQRLGVSQERLADMIGTEVTGATVSRWERGTLMPHPNKRKKLGRIAAKNGMKHIEGAFTPEVGIEDFLAALAVNFPEPYEQILLLDLLVLNAFVVLDCEEEGEYHNRFVALMTEAGELFDRLVELSSVGEEIFVPPSIHHQQFWLDSIERRSKNGEAKKSAR